MYSFVLFCLSICMAIFIVIKKRKHPSKSVMELRDVFQENRI